MQVMQLPIQDPASHSQNTQQKKQNKTPSPLKEPTQGETVVLVGFHSSSQSPSHSAVEGAEAKMTHSWVLMHQSNTIKTLKLYIEHDNEPQHRTRVGAAALHTGER